MKLRGFQQIVGDVKTINLINNFRLRKGLLFFVLLFLSCRTVTHKSSADEIIDVSAKRIHHFLMRNLQLLENKKIMIVPFTINSGKEEKVSLFGLHLVHSVVGISGATGSFLMIESHTKSFSLDEGTGWDFLLHGDIQVRDSTLSITAKILDPKLYILRSYSFLMPLNESIWKYVNDCGDFSCFSDKNFLK
jgi:hypothetical protein